MTNTTQSENKCRYWSDKMRTEIMRYCEFRDIPVAELSRMCFGHPGKLKDALSGKATRFTLDQAVTLMGVMGIRPDRFVGWAGVEDLTVEQIVRSCRKNKNAMQVVNALMREIGK